jgi:hypothetical protein
VADLNGDGKQDLLSGSYMPGDIYWYPGSDKGFLRGSVIAETTPKIIDRMSSAPCVADWDGDGLLDLIIGNMRGEVWWLKNEGTGRAFRFGARKPLLAKGKQIKVTGGDAAPLVVDWDMDGTPDLLLGTVDGTVRFYRGQRDPGGPVTLSDFTMLTAEGKTIRIPQRIKIAVSDWNEDGHLDLLLGNYDIERTSQAGKEKHVGYVYLFLRQP